MKELNHIRDHILIVLSDSDFVYEDNCIRVLGYIDDMSFMVVIKHVENFCLVTVFLRVGFLKMLCLKKL